jgi:hypothetical protein
MQAPPSPLRDAVAHRGDALPPWLSLACAHPETSRSVARYLSYLAPGLAHLGPQPVCVVLHVVAAEDIPEIPPDALALAPRGRYDVARLGTYLLYSLRGQGSVRVDPGAGSVSIWATTDHARHPDLVSGLVSIAVLELAAHRGFFGLHAGAVAGDASGYLLPGASGSGKTSLCLTLVREGFRYLTDDFVLLTADQGRVRCVPFFRTFNLDIAWAERFPELSFVSDLPPLPHGKRMFDPEQSYPGSHVEWARPAVLVFPTIVAHPDSAIRRISKRDAFCRLLPQSRLSADARVATAHVRTLETLVRDSDAFELQHGRDFLHAPAATLRRLLELLGPEPGTRGAR